MKMFVVKYTEHEQGGRPDSYIIGIFDTRAAANDALSAAFKKACDIYLVDENLSDCLECDPESSYYDEGNGFNIDYRKFGELAGEVFGEIEEVEVNKLHLDLGIDTD